VDHVFACVLIPKRVRRSGHHTPPLTFLDDTAGSDSRLELAFLRGSSYLCLQSAEHAVAAAVADAESRSAGAAAEARRLRSEVERLERELSAAQNAARSALAQAEEDAVAARWRADEAVREAAAARATAAEVPSMRVALAEAQATAESLRGELSKRSAEAAACVNEVQVRSVVNQFLSPRAACVVWPGAVASTRTCSPAWPSAA
jgi:hypothetical protein